MNTLHLLFASKKNQELSTLNSSLADFGLAPDEWYLIKEDSLSYKITNKYEPNFFFRGRIQFSNGRKKWGSIYLISL